MKRFLYRAFVRPYEDVFRLVAMVPAIVLMLANAALDLALAARRGEGLMDQGDGKKPKGPHASSNGQPDA